MRPAPEERLIDQDVSVDLIVLVVCVGIVGAFFWGIGAFPLLAVL